MVIYRQQTAFAFVYAILISAVDSAHFVGQRAAKIDPAKPDGYLGSGRGFNTRSNFRSAGRTAAGVGDGNNGTEATIGGDGGGGAAAGNDMGASGPPFMDFPFMDDELGPSTGGAGKAGGQSLHAITPCPPPEGDDAPSDLGDESTIQRIKTQDRYLQIVAHKVAIFGPPADINDREPRNSIELLDDVRDTFWQYCPHKAVPEGFTHQAISTFKILHKYLTPERRNFTSDEELEWVHRRLLACQENKTSFETFTLDPICRDVILGDMNWNPICEDKIHQMDPLKFDPLIDVVFRMFEVVHSVCFAWFQGYSRVWHRFTMAIEDLFNLPMKQRWMMPQGGDAFFKRLLGANYRTYLTNIGKCAEFHGKNTFPVKARLRRIVEPYMVRYRSDIVQPFVTLSPPVIPPGPGPAAE